MLRSPVPPPAESSLQSTRRAAPRANARPADRGRVLREGPPELELGRGRQQPKRGTRASLRFAPRRDGAAPGARLGSRLAGTARRPALPRAPAAAGAGVRAGRSGATRCGLAHALRRHGPHDDDQCQHSARGARDGERKDVLWLRLGLGHRAADRGSRRLARCQLHRALRPVDDLLVVPDVRHGYLGLRARSRDGRQLSADLDALGLVAALRRWQLCGGRWCGGRECSCHVGRCLGLGSARRRPGWQRRLQCFCKPRGCVTGVGRLPLRWWALR